MELRSCLILAADLGYSFEQHDALRRQMDSTGKMLNRLIEAVISPAEVRESVDEEDLYL